MSKLFALSQLDIRNIFRDQMLIFMFIGAPVLQFLLARFALPLFGQYFPVIQPYYPLILLAIVLQITAGIGFVVASIVLDEKDEEVLTAIRVLPISSHLFLAYRLLFAVGVSFCFGLVMFCFSGLASFNWQAALGMSGLFALIAPLILLSLSVFSANKVEGLAVFKGLNFILFLPIIALFVPTLKWLFVWIPTHWTFQYLEALNQGQSTGIIFLMGIIVHLGFLLLLLR